MTIQRAFFLSIAALVLSGCSLPFIGSKSAALQVNSEPQTNVFLNDNHVGQTPLYDDKLKPGDYTVKLQTTQNPSKEWQTTVTLTPEIITFLERQFGPTDAESSNHLLQLEPLTDKNATEISIITVPDNVIVKLDGQPEGFSPVSLKNVAEGDHAIVLAAPGYQEKTINAQVKAGYKLVVSAQLARAPGIELTPPDQNATPSGELDPDGDAAKPTATPSPTNKPATSSSATSSADLERPYVEILDTPTGWLRVRSDPTTADDNEVAQVDPGETFPFIEANATGWYQIEYAPGKKGWISGRYAELYR